MSDTDCVEETENYLFELCKKIPNFINLKILKKYVNTDIESNKEFFDNTCSTYKISNSIKAEWIIYKSIKNSKMIGNGNKNFDLSVNDDIFIDVYVLTLRNNQTNEKTIIQNFSNSADLDTLFKTKNNKEIIKIFKKV